MKQETTLRMLIETLWITTITIELITAIKVAKIMEETKKEPIMCPQILTQLEQRQKGG